MLTAPIPRRAATLVGFAMFLVTCAVNLQVPLYTYYAAAAGRGVGATALMFAIYVAALLPVLFGLGGLSDRIGRRPVLQLALLFAIAASVLVVLVPSFEAVALARALQGIGVALATGAGTAWLAELLPGARAGERAAAIVAVATSLGFGTGALLTSLILLARPEAVPLTYYLHPVLALLVLVSLRMIPQPLPIRATRFLRPPLIARSVLVPGFAICAAWAVTGMVIAVVPAELRRHDLAVFAGAALFCVNGTGALVQPFARRLHAVTAMWIGLVLLPIGYVILSFAALHGWVVLLLAGAALAGSAGYGFVYLGGLATVSANAGAERARAVSGYFLFAYVGFAVPPTLAGALADRTDMATALLVFGAVLFVVVALLLAISVRSRRNPVIAAVSP